MEVYNIKSFEVWTNTDLTEGRGRQKLIGRFAFEDAAIEFAKNKGVMGTPADVIWNEEVITVYDSFEEIQQQKKKDLMKSIRSKLTREEREILGLI